MLGTDFSLILDRCFLDSETRNQCKMNSKFSDHATEQHKNGTQGLAPEFGSEPRIPRTRARSAVQQMRPPAVRGPQNSHTRGPRSNGPRISAEPLENYPLKAKTYQNIAKTNQKPRGCAEMRGPLDRGPRVCEFCGPRTAGGPHLLDRGPRPGLIEPSQT